MVQLQLWLSCVHMDIGNQGWNLSIKCQNIQVPYYSAVKAALILDNNDGSHMMGSYLFFYSSCEKQTKQNQSADC